MTKYGPYEDPADNYDDPVDYVDDNINDPLNRSEGEGTADGDDGDDCSLSRTLASVSSKTGHPISETDAA